MALYSFGAVHYSCRRDARHQGVGCFPLASRRVREKTSIFFRLDCSRERQFWHAGDVCRYSARNPVPHRVNPVPDSSLSAHELVLSDCVCGYRCPDHRWNVCDIVNLGAVVAMRVTALLFRIETTRDKDSRTISVTIVARLFGMSSYATES